MSNWRVIEGNCLEVIPTLAPELRAIVAADPPYGYGHYKTDKDVTLQMLAAAFTLAGIPARSIDGAMSDADRARQSRRTGT